MVVTEMFNKRAQAKFELWLKTTGDWDEDFHGQNPDMEDIYIEYTRPIKEMDVIN